METIIIKKKKNSWSLVIFTVSQDQKAKKYPILIKEITVDIDPTWLIEMIWPRLFPLNRLKGQKKEDNNNKGKYYMNAWKVEKLTNLIIFKKIFVFYKYVFFFWSIF